MIEIAISSATGPRDPAARATALLRPPPPLAPQRVHDGHALCGRCHRRSTALPPDPAARRSVRPPRRLALAPRSRDGRGRENTCTVLSIGPICSDEDHRPASICRPLGCLPRSRPVPRSRPYSRSRARALDAVLGYGTHRPRSARERHPVRFRVARPTPMTAWTVSAVDLTLSGASSPPLSPRLSLAPCCQCRCWPRPRYSCADRPRARRRHSGTPPIAARVRAIATRRWPRRPLTTTASAARATPAPKTMPTRGVRSSRSRAPTVRTAGWYSSSRLVVGWRAITVQVLRYCIVGRRARARARRDRSSIYIYRQS